MWYLTQIDLNDFSRAEYRSVKCESTHSMEIEQDGEFIQVELKYYITEFTFDVFLDRIWVLLRYDPVENFETSQVNYNPANDKCYHWIGCPCNNVQISCCGCTLTKRKPMQMPYMVFSDIQHHRGSNSIYLHIESELPNTHTSLNSRDFDLDSTRKKFLWLQDKPGVVRQELHLLFSAICEHMIAIILIQS